MTVIQEICARIGLVTGSGLGGVLKRKYSKKVVFPTACLLLIANIINIGADIGAMAALARLIIPQLPMVVVTLSFTSLMLCIRNSICLFLLELSMHLNRVVRKNYRITEYPCITYPLLYALDYSYLLHRMFLTVMLRKLFCSIESYATLFTSQRPTGTCTIWPRRS